MAFTTPVQDYVRSPQPVLPESQARYLQEELRKLEQTLKSVTEALKQLDARLTAHGI